MATRFSMGGGVESFVTKKVAILLYSSIILPSFHKHDIDKLQRQQNRSVWIKLWENELSFQWRENF